MRKDLNLGTWDHHFRALATRPPHFLSYNLSSSTHLPLTFSSPSSRFLPLLISPHSFEIPPSAVFSPTSSSSLHLIILLSSRPLVTVIHSLSDLPHKYFLFALSILRSLLSLSFYTHSFLFSYNPFVQLPSHFLAFPLTFLLSLSCNSSMQPFRFLFLFPFLSPPLSS